MPEPLWRVNRVSFRYPGTQTDAVAGVSLEVAAGGITAFIGPNGGGKSTLAHLLLGLHRPSAGTVLFRGQAAHAWPRAALALEVGVLPQGEEMALPLRVREVVAMGRYPHVGAWRAMKESDQNAVASALDATNTADLSDRLLMTLSGGERQRVRLARVLALGAPALILDEPTAALDIRHEMEIFELIRSLGDRGRTVLIVTHNLNLAARYADELVLLADGRVVANGPPPAVLQESTLYQVYGWPMRVTDYPGRRPDIHFPLVVPLTKRFGEPP